MAIKSRLYYLAYVSVAENPFTDDQLLLILEPSSRRNAERAITGMLLYRDGLFLQILEGPEDEVLNLRSAIEKDPRHRDFRVLEQGPLSMRAFGRWSMGFQDLSGTRPKEIPGSSGSARRPHRALQLVHRFQESSDRGTNLHPA